MPGEPDLIGQVRGHYRIDALVGEGAMGRVYRAWDTRLERPVALKVLKQTGDLHAYERLRDEARSASALNHPHIASVYDIFEAGGLACIVMELVRGQPLCELVGGDGLLPATVIEYGRQIADALAHAHERHLVHRDLKSSNIAINESGHVKVLDFGLARRLDASGPGSHTRTGDHGAIAGTLAYMAPEVLRGEGADQGSDVWALGVVLYEMISGTLPFRGESGYAVTGAILHAPAHPLPRSVPRPLATIVGRCLEKERTRRYQRANEVRAALELAASSVRRRKTSSTGVASTPRRPGSSGTAGPRPRSSSQELRSIAVLPMTNLSGEPAQEFFADGMTDALISSLAKVGALKVISRTSVMRYKGSAQSLPEIAAELRVDAVVEGSVLRSGPRVRITAQLIHAATDTHLWSETYDRHLKDVLELQDELARTIARAIQVTVTPQEQQRLTCACEVDPESYELWLRGRHHWNRRSEQSLKTSIALFNEAIERDPAFPLGWIGLADAWNVLGFMGHLRPAEAFPAARAAAERALSLRDDLAEPHCSMAYTDHFYFRDWHASERGYRRAIELNHSYPTAHHWYALLLASSRRFDEARSEIKRAQDLDPLSIIVQVAHGLIATLARDFGEAAAACRTALALDEGFGVGHVWLGWAELLGGGASDAIASFEEGVRVTGRGRDAVAALAHGYAWVGRVPEARALLQELLALGDTAYLAPHGMSLVYAALGDQGTAFEWLERALADRSPWLAFLHTHPWWDPLRADPRFTSLLTRLDVK
jgi:eukaryotic-like serine/threonine-protein kinase